MVLLYIKNGRDEANDNTAIFHFCQQAGMMYNKTREHQTDTSAQLYLGIIWSCQCSSQRYMSHLYGFIMWYEDRNWKIFIQLVNLKTKQYWMQMPRAFSSFCPPYFKFSIKVHTHKKKTFMALTIIPQTFWERKRTNQLNMGNSSNRSVSKLWKHKQKLCMEQRLC